MMHQSEIRQGEIEMRQKRMMKEEVSKQDKKALSRNET